MTPWIIILPLLAQAPEELKFSFSGAGVAIHTESSASQSPLSTAGAVSIGEDKIAYRIVLDREDKPLFAYELDLRKGPSNTVQLTIKPASQEKLRADDFLKGKIAANVPTIAAVRSFPPLRMGDEVRVDIMYNPKTGEKLTDVLRIAPEAQQPPQKSVKVFTGPQFSWEGVKIAMDGKIIADRANNWMVGEAILLRIRDHGEYYLALQPPAGFPFQPVGQVVRNVLRFQVDNNTIEITGRSNLLMKSDTGTVWVYHVPESKAGTRPDSVDITCSGDVEMLMHPERRQKE
jgi:hypothetical protein